jgi:uncharacterized protein YegL
MNASPFRACVRPIASVIRIGQFLPALACAIWLGGCGATTASDGTAMAEWSDDDAQIGASKNSNGGTDAGSTYTGPVASSDATSGGAMTRSTDQGIGLKPGGAQDIGFFRLLLQNGKLPKPGDMTLEGWLNEHDTVLPPAEKDRLVSLHAMAAVVQPAGQPAQGILQLGLNSASSLADVQTSLSLTLVIDNSGSMAGAKIDYVRAGLHVLADKLPKGTRLAVFTFSEDAKLVFAGKVVQPEDLPTLHAAIDAIQATNGTNFHDGLLAGIQDCEGASSDFVQKRVMMLSDGAPTVGDTSVANIVALAGPSAKAGCSISTVGVGLDFSPALMTAVAQQGDGTAWFLQDLAAAKNVFVQDLETMLVAVAQKLWLQFTPAAGWKVQEIYGFEWVEKNGVVQITGPKKAASQPSVPGDPNTQPDPTDPNAPPIAMPTLFASSRNGLVLARLSGPASTDPLQVMNLEFASMAYGYTSSKDQAAAQFTAPVMVPGLVQIPDGGLAYFANAGVRRAWLLLMDGLTLQAAVQMASDAKPTDAQVLLAAALKRHDEQVVIMQADLPVYDASAPDLADAKALLLALSVVIGK